ncbi:MAG: molybdopterin molybdenumtransferase MoeA, partial [Actinobacteria bacterium]|nr:molybdopterin molybdenumtransferase MoeA [Actinomycetota bacterium]
MASELRPAEEVREHILATTRRVSDVVLDYTEAVGRVLSAAVVSDEDVPPFANSAMDGYAVRSTDV